MAKDSDVVCFTCGLAVGKPLRVNTLPSGAPCPSCRDRVLEALPSLLPRSRRGPAIARDDVELDLGAPWAPESSGDEPPRRA